MYDRRRLLVTLILIVLLPFLRPFATRLLLNVANWEYWLRRDKSMGLRLYELAAWIGFPDSHSRWQYGAVLLDAGLPAKASNVLKLSLIHI